jgi:branched-chain amino acid transport system ATP-binding protein
MADLVVAGLCAGYGPMQVVDHVDVRLVTGETVALVGRNGAGKTTTLQAVAGLRFGPASGSVRIGDEDVFSRTPPAMGKLGLALVPEGHRIFAGMSVEENLRLGAFPLRRRKSLDLRSAFDHVYELFPDLDAARKRPAEQLSGGQQQMLAIGQALMCDPTFLLLDEPCAGLAPTVVDRIYDVIARLVAEERGVLLVEQDVQRAMRRSDRTYVMERGKIVLDGPSDALLRDGHVLDLIRGVMEGADDAARRN